MTTNILANAIKEYVEKTIKLLIDFPESLKVTINLSTKSILVSVDVKKEDRGKVIGKKGRTIDALKHITSAIKNTKFPDDSRKVSIEIIEEESRRV